ncbi:energy-coupled thiamine transporter ThiT [Amedibacillus sp. YH-ame10]
MNQKTRKLVFVAFYAALGIVLNYCTKFLPQMPNGGTLELPVIAYFVASFHLGWKYGAATGLISWIVGVVFGLSNYIVSPMQTMLDYIAPVLVVGIAAIFPAIKLGKLNISNIYIGICLGMFLKYMSHTLAGVYFWFPEGSAAGSMAAWIYSGWTYNLFYNLMTLIVAIIIVPVLLRALRKSSRDEFVGIKE